MSLANLYIILSILILLGGAQPTNQQNHHNTRFMRYMQPISDNLIENIDEPKATLLTAKREATDIKFTG